MRGLMQPALDALTTLRDDPHAGHTLAGSLRGFRSLEFAMPGGAYRAAYALLGGERVCLVFMIGPHEGFYAEAERRARALRRTHDHR